jgi:membrane protease subunit (stomatin/prohibitin family)
MESKMGIMDRLRTELVDVIEWVDDSRHTLVWRFPRHQNQIKNGAQLIVRPGQQAIFVHQGQIADVFEPGQHVLATRNLPVLSTLAGWKYGFDSPFKAEVYFVSTRQMTDMKWGTPNPVIVRDADFGAVRLRAFGTYTLRATAPRTLLTELVGADAHFEADEITELLRAIVSSAFADLVASAEIPLMDLATSYGQLSEQLRQMVIERVDDEYGLDIPQLYIVNISLPAEVEKAFDTRTSMDMVGDMARYQAYQLGTALPALAANEGAGGMAGAGMGVGLGMAVASGVPAMTGRGPGPLAASSAPMAPPPPSWHIAENGASVGPFSAPQVVEMISAGRVRPATLVWMAGMVDWMPAQQVPQLAGCFGAAPPPLPGRRMPDNG